MQLQNFVKGFFFLNVPLYLMKNETNELTSLNDQILDHSIDLYYKLVICLMAWLLLL